MAAEGAARSGSRVAGMVCSLWVLVLGSSVLALEEVLLDTTGETSEIGWLTYPPGGWDEVSVLDDQRRLTRTFEACHVAGAPPGTGQDNWLQTHFVERRGAQRAHIRLHFSVRACASLGVAGGTCRETFTLYYRQAEEPDGPDSVSAWHLKLGPGAPPWWQPWAPVWLTRSQKRMEAGARRGVALRGCTAMGRASGW
uniref:EPH receptor B6 n=1 Tax=Neovison vison TaxID=452646 RepID=A0A8C7BZ78_NEOVI